jgi:hypothetical protein
MVRTTLLLLALALATFTLARTTAPVHACPGKHCPTLP